MTIPGTSPSDRASRVREHDAETLPATPAARPVAREAALAHAIDRLPISGDHAAYLGAIAPPDPQIARDNEVRARLDACRDKASGPYAVDGQEVAAAPMFRMTTHAIPARLVNELEVIGKGAGVTNEAIFALRMGQGSTAGLVKVTQALIDAGKLPAGPGDLAARIKTMQWTYGIGMDCAGYSKEALRAAYGKSLGFHAPGMESFRDLDTTRSGSFAKVSIERARPGDLVTLDAAPGGTFGHNVVVYGNDLVDATKRAALVASHGPAMAAFLASPGPHRVLQVDSSWGAGTNGAQEGGYRRDTWLYDASTKAWASFTPGTTPPQLVVSKDGPAEDRFHGVYRPR